MVQFTSNSVRSPIIRSLVTQLPNILTILRGFAGPWIAWLFYTGDSTSFSIALIAFLCLFIASVTDFLDGFIARALHAESKLGQMLDPWTDKILVLCVFATLPNLDADLYPWWIFWLIASREILVEGVRGWRRLQDQATKQTRATSLAFPVKISGKVKTTVQMVFIHLALGLHLLDVSPHPYYILSGPILSSWAMYWLYLITAAVTIWSGIDTLRSYAKQPKPHKLGLDS